LGYFKKSIKKILKKRLTMPEKTPTTIAFVPQREWLLDTPKSYEDGRAAIFGVDVQHNPYEDGFMVTVHGGTEFGFKSKPAADTFANFLAAAFAEAAAVAVPGSASEAAS
jgi:hypothetical protein